MKAALTLSAGLSLSALTPGFTAEKISFNRDIRPIMSDTCFHCHGFDAKTREAGLRLDIREEAIKETEEGALPIVPGDPGKSEIIFRIFDESDPMPPEKAHKPFTPEQKELFRRWVEEGAVYEPHWAYAPLLRPELPAGKESLNPIDAFIREKLAQKKVSPSPEAAPQALARRLSLDLTGLPPHAHEFYKPEMATGDFIDALLASPHFGERFAVWWLDIARYADTVGFHGDQNQRIFPYRDYVIEAFNTNKRFDDFTREQLAGDLLPKPTPEQLTATGYNRLNMMTREGGAQPKEYLAKYGAERVRSVAAAWFGSTFGCAECHDHKFDPIKASDFYELQSFFADVKQWGVYSSYGYSPEPELEGFNNEFPFPPEIEVESPWLKKQHGQVRKSLDEHLAASLAKLAADPKTVAAQSAWEEKMRAYLGKNPDGGISPALVTHEIQKNGKPLPERKAVLDPSGTIQPDKALGKGESLSLTMDPAGLPALAAIKLQIDVSGIAPESLKARLGKSLSPTFSIRQPDGKIRKLPILTADATAKRPLYRGGAEVPGIQGEWRLPKTLPTDSPLHSIWIVDGPVALSTGEQVVISITGDNTLPLHIALSPFGSLDALKTGSEISSLMTIAADRNPDQIREVAELYFFSVAPDRPAWTKAHQLAGQIRELNEGRAWTLVTEAAPNPLTVRVLPRGNWQDETGPVVLPSTPSFLPGRIESTAEKRLTRLDLANWIVSDANPITARAVMNRLWAQFFGTGLSAVVDDLGSQGELPSHPELLDWLAFEFRESGWDMKRMIRLIVTSETYRQSSHLRPELKDLDPANRLLASQNPRRLDAEFVRDNALSIAGLLKLEDIGGPSVKPYQPAGYYEALQFPNRDYVADTDSRQWRRGVYTHWQRTFLHPMMANFDAPARDECAAARTMSNTPQQALTLLNDPAFVEAARVFAARLLNEKAKDDQARLALAFRLTVNREPKPKETEALTLFLTNQRESYKATPKDATKLLATGLAPKAELDPVEHAAWTQVARVLLNTHETITRY